MSLDLQSEQNTLICIDENLSLAFQSKHQLLKSGIVQEDECTFLELDDACYRGRGDMLLIHKMRHFGQWLQNAIKQSLLPKITLYWNEISPMLEIVLFLGAFLVMSEHRTAERVNTIFSSYSNKTVDMSERIDSVECECETSWLEMWKALEHARRLGWMNWAPDADEYDPLHIDELAHYANPANGAVHIISPNRLIVFPNPAALPDGELWSTDSPVRRFSAAFYADLLRDLGAVAVARLAAAPRTDFADAALAAAGLDTLDFAPRSAGPTSPLRALDGLLSLSRSARGAVALCPGGGSSIGGGRGAGWPAHTGLVATAFLVSREGFSGRTAHAWLALVCPALLARPPATPAPLPSFSSPPVSSRSV